VAGGEVKWCDGETMAFGVTPSGIKTMRRSGGFTFQSNYTSMTKPLQTFGASIMFAHIYLYHRKQSCKENCSPSWRNFCWTLMRSYLTRKPSGATLKFCQRTWNHQIFGGLPILTIINASKKANGRKSRNFLNGNFTLASLHPPILSNRLKPNPCHPNQGVLPSNGRRKIHFRHLQD